MNSAKTREEHFIIHLEKYAKAENRAALAALRRGLGQEPGSVPEMYPHVEWYNVTQYNESYIYMIAALFALHPSSTKFGNMGDHLRSLVRELGDDASTERRFVQLLRMRRGTLEPRLRQHISILKSKDIAVNWHQLFGDLRNWGHPNRFVQRNWARAFWGYKSSESEND